LQIADLIDAPPIHQKLYRSGEELVDDSATLEQLGVIAHDELTLRLPEQMPIDNHKNQDHDEASYKAFGGTVLGGTMAAGGKTGSDNQALSVSCPACTYWNAAGVNLCEMCETIL